ncbi:Protein fantom [Bagarius yarrelli]|uniref:Protein fantom n=1 Tax=Bagarius yarrelli TaxID=175774 RepID=A0A556U418_BAGYA|nr:Protein fantom [Bagarius yarrelli]
MSRLTLADETAGDIPVRDITLALNGLGKRVLEKELLPFQNARARQAVAKISREDLEDRYLRMQEENHLLKQHSHKQEDKIKRMATKLIRLVKDRKRLEQASGERHVIGGRNVEMEEMIEELQEKIHELEKQNNGLKQRLLTAKQQIQIQSRRPTPYSHIQSRIKSGLRQHQEDMLIPPQQTITPRGAETRHVEGEISSRPPQGLLPRYGHSLLDDARSEIRNLENVIETQRAEMEEIARSAEMLREQLRIKEREYEGSLLQLREQQTTGQRLNIKDNVEMIKLQKQLADRENSFTVLEGRFLQLQDSQKTLKASHDTAMAKVDELTGQLKEEKLRILGLENQLQTKALQEKMTSELLEQIRDLEKERNLLKENCDKLVNSAFDVIQEPKWKTREQQLKLQIAQLEMALKSDLTDKNQILDKIKAERDLNEKLIKENRELQLSYLEQKQQFDEMKDRMKFFTKVRKTQKNGELSFLEKVEEEVQIDTDRSLKELQATYAETVQELEKTRNMLIIQHKINKDYQAEVEAVTRRMNDLKMDNELKQEKLAQLLDMRAAKIKKLEGMIKDKSLKLFNLKRSIHPNIFFLYVAQLKDIAYGTKAHVFRPDITDNDVADEFDETVNLARGENLLEIHLGTAQFSPEALDSLGDKEPATFCTYAFYDFELQSTAVVRGPQPVYNFTSQYLVKVDDLFLQYIHSSSVTVEVQLAECLTFRTIAAGQIRLSHVLERDGKVFDTLQLVGLSGEIRVFGTLDFWLRLRVPMEQAIRLYKERVKAVGFLNSSVKDESQTSISPSSSSSFKDKNLNELYITIRCCSKLKSRGPHIQPSPYVIYKFLEFTDHDTSILPSTNEPQFEDHMTFPLTMNSDLDAYLKAEALTLYVFDDLDLDNQLYLGKANVPLISLAHDKAITGTFELTDPAGLPSGYIDVTLKWKFTYLPPSGLASAPEQAKFFTKEAPIRPATDEAKNMNESISATTPLPKPRLHTLKRQAAKKVSFLNVTEPEIQKVEIPPPSGDQENKPSIVPTSKETVREVQVGQFSAVTEEEEEDEESHFSEGQVFAVSSSFVSDDSEISEELEEPEEDIQPAGCADRSESILSDSDDCIVPAQSTQAKKQVCTTLFTVVSDPPEELELEKECEDVGVAYFRISDIVKMQRNMMDISLDIVDVQDSTKVVGTLKVTVEALEALRSIMEDSDRDRSKLQSER